MSETPGAGTFYGSVPVFRVEDVMVTAAYYRDVLGFEVDFVYGEPPFYAQVKRDRGLLNLKCMDEPVIDPKLRDR